MARESIVAFQERLARDEALREELMQLKNDNGSIPVAEVIRIAGANGYDFSLEDVGEALKDGELSDEELDQVAGGATLFTIQWYKPLLSTQKSLLTDIDLNAAKVGW